MSRRAIFAAPSLWLLWICIIAFVELTQSRSIFAVGRRIYNDQLLVKDILEAKILGDLESPEVKFQYSIPQPITYIEILSNADVHAEINFSYQNDIVSGKVKGPVTETITDNNQKFRKSIQTFDVQILIYGFNETVLNVNPSYIINRNAEFKGNMEPHMDSIEDNDNYINADEQYETIKKFDDIYINNNNSQLNSEYLDENDEEHVREEDEDDEDDEDYNDQIDINTLNNEEDKIIELGRRQSGDQLLYDTFQTSSEASSQPSDHTVVFYYIDSNFITNIRFVIYGHYSGKSTMSDEYKPPVAEYSHFSPTSLKAAITEFNTTSLFVNMFVFGYRPADVNSISYVPYLVSLSQKQQQQQVAGHTYEMSTLDRLKLLMKTQQTGNSNLDAEDNTSYVNKSEMRESTKDENSLANNIILISDKAIMECAQQGGSISGATPSFLIHLQSFQTNAVVIYLLLLLFVCIFSQVSIVQYY